MMQHGVRRSSDRKKFEAGGMVSAAHAARQAISPRTLPQKVSGSSMYFEKSLLLSLA